MEGPAPAMERSRILRVDTTIMDISGSLLPPSQLDWCKTHRKLAKDHKSLKRCCKSHQTSWMVQVCKYSMHASSG